MSMHLEPHLKGLELYGWMIQEWVDTSHDATQFLKWVEENYPEKLPEILAQKKANEEYKKTYDGEVTPMMKALRDTTWLEELKASEAKRKKQ